MGAIQQPTPEMGPYRTETRGESFYLTLTSTTPLSAERLDRHTLRVPASHAAFILAALDQVTGLKSWAEWERDDGGRQGAVTVARDGEHLVLRLPAPVYARGWDDEFGRDSSISVEIPYWEVAGLREQLTADRATLPVWAPQAPGEEEIR